MHQRLISGYEMGIRFAVSFHLPLPKAKQIFREVESAVSRWRVVGRSLGMDKRKLEAFEHPERRAAQRAMR